MPGEFTPIAVAVHEDLEDIPKGNVATLGSIMGVDDATEAAHPVVVLTFATHSGDQFHCIVSLKQYLITVKLLMDGYPDYVREAFTL